VEEAVADLLGCRCFVVGREAFVLFSPDEVRMVFTSPPARGRGLARRLVGAAVRAMAGPAVIVADDEDSPKELYEKIGFVPAWTMWEFVRRPRAAMP
jgi:GNAT superfamily N-acetyltransferase